MANWEGGQTDSPIRPAAGVGSWQARRHIPRSSRHLGTPRVDGYSLGWRLSDSRWRQPATGNRLMADGSGAMPRRVNCHGPMLRCACAEPTPAAGRIGLSVWPSSTLARRQPLASEGTRAMDGSVASASAASAKPAQQEKCPALVRRAHAQASKRADPGLPLETQDVTHRRRRGSEGHFLRFKRPCHEQEVTLASAVAPAP